MSRTSSRPAYIYLLTDKTGIRYVGVSVNPSHRLKYHRFESLDKTRGTYHLPKSRWMRKHSQHVRLRVLKSATERECYELEPRVIAECLRRGHRLLNLAPGGYRPPRISELPNAAEVRAKISAAAKGRTISPETRQKMSAAHKGKAEHLRRFATVNGNPANKPVIRCLADGTPVETYRSGRVAAASVGVKPASITDALKGRTKVCAGYRWKYA